MSYGCNGLCGMKCIFFNMLEVLLIERGFRSHKTHLKPVVQGLSFEGVVQNYFSILSFVVNLCSFSSVQTPKPLLVVTLV